MTHPIHEAQLDAYLDGELEPADAHALESHLGHCPECTRFLDARLALRSAIKARVPRLQAPPPLVEHVRNQMRPRRPVPRVVWRSLALAASLAVVAFGGWRFGFQRGVGATLADEVLTPDSSRFWPVEGYAEGINPPSYDKQFVRDWLEQVLVDGKPWDKRAPAPPLPAAVVDATVARYREALDRLMAPD